MHKRHWVLGLFLFASSATMAQSKLQNGSWRAALHREDGVDIVFNLDVQQQKGKTVFYVVNGAEKMLVNDVSTVQDSLVINMPVFESSFRVKVVSKDSIAGTWIKRGATKDLLMPFSATAKEKYRFAAVNGNAQAQAGGKWKVDFVHGDKHDLAIGNFVQQGNDVTGSILTPSGDYRFLAGTITGNLLQVSTFDGNHALVFTGRISGDEIAEGKVYSSKAPVGEWTASRDANVKLPDEKMTAVKEGSDGKLDFSFQDIDGKKVSINDARFKNKVVVIQLMGSWCPNCMDETAFMSEYYKKNKQRGVEMIGLAYEYTTDVARSKASIRKFQQRFDVQYPLLIAPATVSDPERTAKTLPQLTNIKIFPTTLILDKTGKVAEIETDFFGPGTGEYYTEYKDKFEKTITGLLKQ